MKNHRDLPQRPVISDHLDWADIHHISMTDTDRQRTPLPGALPRHIDRWLLSSPRPAATRLFFQGNGIFQLPVATIMITAASLPLAMFFVKAMKTWGARPARVGLMLFAAAVLGFARRFFSPANRRCCSIFSFLSRAFSGSSSRAYGCLPAISSKPRRSRRPRGPSVRSAPARSPAAWSAVSSPKGSGRWLNRNG